MIEYPSYSGQDDVVDFLIKNGVDINLKDNSGRAPIYVASIFGNKRSYKNLNIFKLKLISLN